MLDFDGGTKHPFVGLRKARAANSATGPRAPASLPAAAMANPVANRWRTPRAQRDSGPARKKSYRLRRRVALTREGHTRPAPQPAGSSNPLKARRACLTNGRTHTRFGAPCATQPPRERPYPRVAPNSVQFDAR